ncbi:MAG: carboxypeptidase-like regulatory domain-containing protein [Myxococcota bacterium]
MMPQYRWLVFVSLCMLSTSCASGGTLSQDERPDTTVTVVDASGAPIEGAEVYWYERGNPPFICSVEEEPLRQGYVRSGHGVTGPDGRADIGAGVFGSRPLVIQIVGPDGSRTLGSIPAGEEASIAVRETAELVLTTRCTGGSCGEISAWGDINHEGGECMIKPSDATEGKVGPIQVPRGTLTITLRAKRGTPEEALGRFTFDVKDDVNRTVELATIGGGERLEGTVTFPDGDPPGGEDYYSPVEIECENGLSRITHADPSTGAFVFDALPSDDCQVTATHAGSRPGRWTGPPIEVQPAEQESVEIEMKSKPE